MISMDRKYIYRNGEPARILCVDAPGNYPVVTLDELGRHFRHDSDGVCNVLGITDEWDLIEVKEKKTLEFWVNVLPNGGVIAHNRREDADHNTAELQRRIACKHVVITYEEGEGL